jgi:SAM-dependent methyltransferase
MPFSRRDITYLPNCLCCGAFALTEVLDLGIHPLANTLLANPTDAYSEYPLILNRCTQCGHGQLRESVSPDVLYKNYAYASGTSKTLNRYFDWFAQECADIFAPGASCLEIACNDGSLLHCLDSRGFFTFGVDPAENITAGITGLRIENAMWPCEPPVGPYANYDLVIAQNVLAHGPDPLAFLQAIKQVLAPDGIAVIQTSQGRMLEEGQFDNIYHEHMSFFTLSSMAWLASRAALRLRTVREVSVHGVSICWVLDHPDDTGRDIRGFLATGEFALSREIPRLGSADDYACFTRKVDTKIQYIRNAILARRDKGEEVAFVGYAAKAAVVLHATGIQPDYVYDEAPLKVGRWVPGIDRQVLPLRYIGQAPEGLLVVISAWNYRDEIVAKVRAFREGKATTFMTYFPDAIEEFT